MNAVSNTGIVEEDKTLNIAIDQTAIKGETVVLCGACGTQERVGADGKTECPRCDEYIY